MNQNTDLIQPRLVRSINCQLESITATGDVAWTGADFDERYPDHKTAWENFRNRISCAPRMEDLHYAFKARIEELGTDYIRPLVRCINFDLEEAMTPEEVAKMRYPDIS